MRDGPATGEGCGGGTEGISTDLAGGLATTAGVAGPFLAVLGGWTLLGGGDAGLTIAGVAVTAIGGAVGVEEGRGALR